jgi:hypothetical protein
MSKRVRRDHHPRRRRSRTSRVKRHIQPRVNSELSKVRSSARLLDRLLATPHLAHVVPRLQPEVLHRVIQHCGLEDCGQLVALTTPRQLARVFDLDLWRPPAPGRDEQFDAGRFAVWLEVMVDADPSSAAAMLAAMDEDLVAAGFVQHVRVFDYAAIAPYRALDGELSAGVALDESLRCEVGGYVVVAKARDHWDAITAILSTLAEAHGPAFNRVMRLCCRQSNLRPEIDRLDDLPTTDEQALFDLAVEREARRDAQGYVTPAQARAFLHTARRIDLRQGTVPARDPVTRAYFRGVEAQAPMETGAGSAEVPADLVTPVRDASAEAVAAIVALLDEAGVTPRVPRALLEGPQTTAPRFTRIQAHLHCTRERDPLAYGMRQEELAYLANVIVAGSTIQSRPVAEDEASRAAVAVCNLGLENWPVHWLAGDVRRGAAAAAAGTELPEDFLTNQDLVAAFQVGWTVLHEDVCMDAAERLIDALTSLRCSDGYVQDALETLRVTLTKHWRGGSPWNARDALDVIAILDPPAWAAVLGLLDQFPTMHAAIDASLAGTTRQIDAAAFEFISENAQVKRVRDFMAWLPGILRG